MLHHRKSLGAKPAQFHENLLLEIVWTIIPIIILISLAIPGSRVLMHMRDESNPDLTIKVTGFQWKWKYDYIDQNISFFSNLSTPFDERLGKAPKNPNYLREVDHPLVVPIHKKIRFLVTSNDVIHSWWVPDFGVKQDAVPGFINENWTRIERPGTYRGQCVELCGVNHAFMPIVVIALSEKEFDDWVAKQKGQQPGAAQAAPAAQAAAIPATTKPAVATKTKPGKTAPVATAPTTAAATATPAVKQYTLDELIARGKTIFLNTCAACHQPNGQGMPPTFPNLITSPIVNGPVAKHIHTVVFGVPGSAMQAFGQQFSPDDIAAVITYERNEIGSKKGDIVQPADIIAAEKAGS